MSNKYENIKKYLLQKKEFVTFQMEQLQKTMKPKNKNKEVRYLMHKEKLDFINGTLEYIKSLEKSEYYIGGEKWKEVLKNVHKNF